MFAFVSCYDFKIIRKGLGDHFCLAKDVPSILPLARDIIDERLECHVEDDGGVVVPSEDSIAEGEGFRLTYYKLQITNYKLQITYYKLQITNYRTRTRTRT